MNLRKCARLSRKPETRTWFRATELAFLETSLSSAHTPDRRSRFSGGPSADSPFEVLYLAPTTMVAQFEIGSILGSPFDPNLQVSHPSLTTVNINVKVTLQAVADLTSISEQELIGTNAQELTGDWDSYYRRTNHSQVPQPRGLSPTQQPGQALFAVDGLEGFLTLSAKVPVAQNLVVFPTKLLPGSELIFEYAERNLSQTISGPRRRPRRR